LLRLNPEKNSVSVASKNYILFDDGSWDRLLPLTFTRPTAEIRIGITTIREKWEYALGTKCSYITKPYLAAKYKSVIKDENTLINGTVIPDSELIAEINKLEPGEVLVKDDVIVAVVSKDKELKDINAETCKTYRQIRSKASFLKINHLWELFKHNGEVIVKDFGPLTKGRKSADISVRNNILVPENVFAEEGARVEFATINASAGPVYIGKEAEVMEGSIIRGPFALGEHSTLKMGAKIYGPTTIGPFSKAGGEVNNSIIMGYSNKAHDGFLGNSVIGEWCNLGAGTNNSNLKNNYADVKVWSYITEKFEDSGQQFCGLVMGDHSKCGINTMFNTGTVVGVSANIFGSGFPRTFIPSFAWGGAGGFTTFLMAKALEVAQRVMERRNIKLTDADSKIMEEVFNITSKYRRFE
jgi:UDP-N-acetylglucosamine diphosphorylase/glucosamine-1-phosphate N-acetyltransferase